MNSRTAALNGNNHSQEIKDQIVQTLTEAGGQVDYVEVMFMAFPYLFKLSLFVDLLSGGSVFYSPIMVVVMVADLIVLWYNYSVFVLKEPFKAITDHVL